MTNKNFGQFATARLAKTLRVHETVVRVGLSMLKIESAQQEIDAHLRNGRRHTTLREITSLASRADDGMLKDVVRGTADHDELVTLYGYCDCGVTKRMIIQKLAKEHYRRQ